MSRATSASAIEPPFSSTPLRSLTLGLVSLTLGLMTALLGVGCGDAKDGAASNGPVRGDEARNVDAAAPTPTPAPDMAQTPAPAAVPPAPPAPPAPAAPSTPPAKDQVKMSKEFWPSGGIKYTYEMRRSSNGKWARNGIGRAYYEHGQLEREGSYKNNVRIGIWKYYDVDGKHIRTEDRGTDGDGGSSGDPPLP